ncbi:MAG: ABC transporter ATP-binding protein [Christensenellales bacterium]|jgi:putative ABC transport system ATP-binding protein
MDRKETQIVLENVCKKYDDHVVLENINLKVFPRDFLCIFGKSGSGKSTLLNIMGTLENYDKGSVTCFSKIDPVRHDKESEVLRRRNIAYLFQNFALVEKMTVEENMLLAIKYSDDKNKALKIQDALNKMGVANKLKSKIYELSGGEQQRVAIARNLVKPFDVMLADEPTGSLDNENKKIVMDTLVKLNDEGKTIIVVSHDKDFKGIADKSYVLKDGKLKEVTND